jgi:hypothetical protein
VQKGGAQIAPQRHPRELFQSFSNCAAIVSSPPDYFACMMAGLRKAYNPKYDHSAAPQTSLLCHPTFQTPASIAPLSVFRKST